MGRVVFGIFRILAVFLLVVVGWTALAAIVFRTERTRHLDVAGGRVRETRVETVFSRSTTVTETWITRGLAAAGDVPDPVWRFGSGYSGGPPPTGTVWRVGRWNRVRMSVESLDRLFEEKGVPPETMAAAARAVADVWSRTDDADEASRSLDELMYAVYEHGARLTPEQAVAVIEAATARPPESAEQSP